MQFRLMLVLAATAVGCAPPTASEGISGCLPNAPVHVTSAPGVAPQFSWLSGCRGFALQVLYSDSAGGFQPAWLIQTDRANVLESPIGYGVAPSAVTASFGPAVLVPGTVYYVGLIHHFAPGLDSITAAGVFRY